MMDYQNDKFVCVCDDCGKSCDGKEDAISFFNSDLCAECEAIKLAYMKDLDKTLALNQESVE